jgi:hypothetical protein
MTTPGNETSPYPWLPLASKILQGAVAEDWPKVQSGIKKFVRDHGTNQVPYLLRAMIDTLLTRSQAYSEPGRLDRLVFQEKDTGQLSGVDEVPPATRWAGRLIMARAAMDQDQWVALMRSVGNSQEWSACCDAVIQLVALNLRRGGLRVEDGAA